MTKQLARIEELHEYARDGFMDQLNAFAQALGLAEYSTYSRIWEYPWLWLHLKRLRRRSLRVVDIGSERSPFPWYLATEGFDVVVSDVTAEYWRLWQAVARKLRVPVRTLILDAQDLDLPTASVDIYVSLSVIEHVPDKGKTILEAARVLRPGGLLIMTFDICEPDMGMTFPSWNGRALLMREFDELFAGSSWFEPGLAELQWNRAAIPDYLAWHRTTAPHHNYVTGGAVVKRSMEAWQKTTPRRDFLRAARSSVVTVAAVGGWYLRRGPHLLRRIAGRPIRPLRKWLGRLRTPPLSSLPDSPDLFRLYPFWLRHPDVERRPGGWFYQGDFYPDYLTVGGAGHAIFREALKYCQGTGSDFGAGLWPLPGAIPVDATRGPGLGKSIGDFADGSLDYVFSSHCLEHIEGWRPTLAEWIGKLKPGGILFLYLPHPSCAIWHPGSPFVGDEHKWVPTPEILKESLAQLGCEIMQCDDGPDAMFSFWVCGRKKGTGRL
jgi:SAM-dependent methyltransferase